MSHTQLSFFARLKLAFAFLFGGRLPEAPALPAATPAPAAPPPAVDPAAAHQSGLYLLSVLQREGRLIDFLQEDLTSASDAEVGAVARVVHQGCKKVLAQYLEVAPVLTQSEGAQITVPQGFDANRYRLSGNVTGLPPYQGSLKHHGWEAKAVRLPMPPAALDAKVLAPAEVELP